MAEVNERQRRLELMRVRKEQIQSPATLGDLEQPNEEAKPSRGPRQMLQQGGGQRRSRMMLGKVIQRIQAMLHEPVADARNVPGTDVPEQNLEKLIDFLIQRAQNPEAKGAKIAQRVLDFLTKGDATAVTVGGVKIDQFKRYLDMLNKASSRASAPGLGNRWGATTGRPGNKRRG